MAAVTVYTRPGCAQCRSTKTILKNLGVPFEEVTVPDEGELIDNLKAAGYKELPVVVAPNETWSGFQFEKLKELRDEVA